MFMSSILKIEQKHISNNMPKKYKRTNIGLIITEMRKDKKLTAYDICDALDLSLPTLYAYQNDIANPSLHVFIELMQTLNCEIQIVSKDDPTKKVNLKLR